VCVTLLYSAFKESVSGIVEAEGFIIIIIIIIIVVDRTFKFTIVLRLSLLSTLIRTVRGSGIPRNRAELTVTGDLKL
jgi:hypothetical protein